MPLSLAMSVNTPGKPGASAADANATHAPKPASVPSRIPGLVHRESPMPKRGTSRAATARVAPRSEGETEENHFSSISTVLAALMALLFDLLATGIELDAHVHTLAIAQAEVPFRLRVEVITGADLPGPRWPPARSLPVSSRRLTHRPRIRGSWPRRHLYYPPNQSAGRLSPLLLGQVVVIDLHAARIFPINPV